MDSNYASSFVAKMIFLTKGKGLHKDHRDAAISDLNLVSVSSIMPPECKISKFGPMKKGKFLRINTHY
jgi:pyruvoyl-dependent arginine decarboxylase (PvlArgDC)